MCKPGLCSCLLQQSSGFSEEQNKRIQNIHSWLWNSAQASAQSNVSFTELADQWKGTYKNLVEKAGQILNTDFYLYILKLTF